MPVGYCALPRCNFGGRRRWGIESEFNVEKHQGYHYEHSFSLDWNAMRGYHILMRMAHLFNTLARFAAHLKIFYAQLGVRSMIDFIRSTCAGPWLNFAEVQAILKKTTHLQLE